MRHIFGKQDGTNVDVITLNPTWPALVEGHLTFFAAFDGDLLVGFCTWLLSVTGCLDTEPFSRFLLGEDGAEDGGGEGEAGGVEEEGGPAARTAISSVAVRCRLRRLSCVSWSTTSNLVSLSMALIRCTT